MYMYNVLILIQLLKLSYIHVRVVTFYGTFFMVCICTCICVHPNTHQFGKEVDIPSDAQRVQKVKTLVEAGFSHRVMLAHDIHTKHRLVSGQCRLELDPLLQ